MFNTRRALSDATMTASVGGISVFTTQIRSLEISLTCQNAETTVSSFWNNYFASRVPEAAYFRPQVLVALFGKRRRQKASMMTREETREIEQKLNKFV